MRLPVMPSFHFGFKDLAKIGPGRLPKIEFPVKPDNPPETPRKEMKEQVAFKHDVPFSWIA